MGRHLMLYCGAALMLFGCASYHPKPIVPGETASRIESRTLEDRGLRDFINTNKVQAVKEWPLKKWGLEDLTFAAFYYHPSLGVARTDWIAAKAAIITAGGKPNPTLTFGPGYNFSAMDATPWLPFGNLDWPIETAGKRGHRIKQAEHISESALFNLVKAGWQVRSHLRSALVDLTSATQREVLLDRQISLQQRAIELLEQQRLAGAISAAEVIPARLSLQKVRLDRSDARRQRVEAQSRLAEDIGVTVGALEGVELEFDLGLPVAQGKNLLSAEARRRALLSRADVLEGLADYAASEAALQLEVAKQYPDVRINPGYQLDDGQHKWTFGASIELPILNQNQGPIAEGRARREASASKFEQVQSNAIAEVDRAAAILRVTETNLSEAEGLVAIQRKQAQSIEQQYQAGGVDRVSLITAQVELAASEAALLDGRTKAQQAIGALEDAIQQPLDGSQPMTISMLTRNDNSAMRERKANK